MHPRVPHPDFGATNWHEAVRPGTGLRRRTYPLPPQDWFLAMTLLLLKQEHAESSGDGSQVEGGERGVVRTSRNNQRRKNAKIARSIYMTLASASHGKSDITLQRQWLNVDPLPRQSHWPGRYQGYIPLFPDDEHKNKGATSFTGAGDDSYSISKSYKKPGGAWDARSER